MSHKNCRSQEPLDMFATPDVLQGEQTWPLEDEMEPFPDDAETGPGRPAVQESNAIGTKYHDEWFEDEDEDMSGGEHDEDLPASRAAPALHRTPDVPKRNSQDKPLTWEEVQYSDEMESPSLPMTVRGRYSRYRALQSFKHAEWHPYENLPVDYSRIFTFQQFGITQRRFVCRVRPGPAKRSW